MDALRKKHQSCDPVDSSYESATNSSIVSGLPNERHALGARSRVESLRNTFSISKSKRTPTLATRPHTIPTSHPTTPFIKPRVKAVTSSSIVTSNIAAPVPTPYIVLSSTSSHLHPATSTTSHTATRNPVSRHDASLRPQPQSATAPRSLIRTIQGMRIFNTEVDEGVMSRFNAISDTLEPPLIGYLRKGRSEFRPLGLQLLVLGYSEEDAKPWIVVLCPEPVRKKVVGFFQDDFARGTCRAKGPNDIGFQVAVVGRPLRSTASEQQIRVYGEERPSDTHVIWRPRIRIVHSGKSHHAITGGFVCVMDAFGKRSVYGLTTGHILPPDPMGTCPVDHSSQYHRSNNLDISFIHRSLGAQNHATSDGVVQLNGSHSLGRGSDIQQSQWSCLGVVSRASYSARARNRDWALFKLSEQPKEMPSIPVRTSKLSYVAARPTADEDVLLYDGSFNTGRFSNLPARAMLAYADRFVSVHVLALAEQNVSCEGSSGAWVVDTNFDKRTNVYGLLAAQDPFEALWVVPMSDVLQDIREELNAATVSLPTSREILNAIGANASKQESKPHQSNEQIMGDATRWSRLLISGADESHVVDWEHEIRARETNRKVEARPFESDENPLFVPSKWTGSVSHLQPVFVPIASPAPKGSPRPSHGPGIPLKYDAKVTFEPQSPEKKQLPVPRTEPKQEEVKDRLARMIRDYAAPQRWPSNRRHSSLSQADTLFDSRSPSLPPFELASGANEPPVERHERYLPYNDAIRNALQTLDGKGLNMSREEVQALIELAAQDKEEANVQGRRAEEAVIQSRENEEHKMPLTPPLDLVCMLPTDPKSVSHARDIPRAPPMPYQDPYPSKSGSK